MSRLKLTLACGAYDLLRPLMEGAVAPAGIDLNVVTMASPERHGRMLRHEQNGKAGFLSRFFDGLLNGIVRGYHKTLEWVLYDLILGWKKT